MTVACSSDSPARTAEQCWVVTKADFVRCTNDRVSLSASQHCAVTSGVVITPLSGCYPWVT
jgi:hypothetical protein